MSEPEKPKPNVQLHLSTFLLLVILAGAMVWGQLRQDAFHDKQFQGGWPFPVIILENGKLPRGFEITVFADVVFCITILLCTAFFLEALILYRQGRKP